MRYLALLEGDLETRYDGYSRIPYEGDGPYDFPPKNRGKSTHVVDGFRVYNDQGIEVSSGKLMTRLVVARGITPRLHLEYAVDDVSPCPCCGK